MRVEVYERGELVPVRQEMSVEQGRWVKAQQEIIDVEYEPMVTERLAEVRRELGVVEWRMNVEPAAPVEEKPVEKKSLLARLLKGLIDLLPGWEEYVEGEKKFESLLYKNL